MNPRINTRAALRMEPPELDDDPPMDEDGYELDDDPNPADLDARDCAWLDSIGGEP